MPLFGEKEELVELMLRLEVNAVTVTRNEKGVFDCKIYNNNGTMDNFAFMAQRLAPQPQAPQPPQEPGTGTGKETEVKPETKPESKAEPPKPEKKKPDTLSS